MREDVDPVLAASDLLGCAGASVAALRVPDRWVAAVAGALLLGATLASGLGPRLAVLPGQKLAITRPPLARRPPQAVRQKIAEKTRLPGRRRMP
jgi:hypothetical protein